MDSKRKALRTKWLIRLGKIGVGPEKGPSFPDWQGKIKSGEPETLARAERQPRGPDSKSSSVLNMLFH